MLKNLNKIFFFFVENKEHEHGEENEDKNADDVIETTKLVVAITSDNNLIGKVEFHYEIKLTCIEEWHENPKYDEDENVYGKILITKKLEGIEDIQPTMKVVEAIIIVEWEVEENEDIIFYLSQVDRKVQLAVVDLQENA